MAEPTSTTLAGYAAAASGVTLALLGVDYHSLLYGFVGALLAISNSERMTRARAVVYAVLSTLTGAVIGNAAVAFFETTNRSMLIFGCLIGGAGAQGFVYRFIKRANTLIDTYGNKTKGKDK